MRNVVFVDLNHSNKGGFSIREGCFTTDANNPCVVKEGGYHSSGTIGSDDGISVNLKQELVESWINTDDVTNMVMHFKLKGRHRQIIVYAVEETHDDHLRIAFASVTRSNDILVDSPRKLRRT